ncbi:MAG: 50S ribosomal protein L11 methyltransferase [Zoogloeaceae bacterium]|nr:50S ribosomal protein L11 methyltransferase [Zoogloeaceae bacterium]
MAWINLSFLADARLAEPWCDALLEAGAASASIEDADAGTPEEKPQFGEPGMDSAIVWEHARIVALFAENVACAASLAQAAAALGQEIPAHTLARLEEENWVQLTQAQFEPIRISSRLWIVPSWHASPDPAAINLILDPGMAFGTGSHPTTRLCLEWLEREVRPGMRLLDYGCGSGILAIAAARLGASLVAGLDIDPQAVIAARANAERNGVEARFMDAAEVVDVTDVANNIGGGAYDLVVANILANPLRLLAPAIAAHVRPGGKLALSGLLAEQAEEMIAIYAQWITLEIAGIREGWVCLSGEKVR